MDKQKILHKIKVMLGLVKDQFATAKLESGEEISFDALEINREVYDAEGNPLTAGDYTLEDGTKITVDENGVIKEIVLPDGEEKKEEVVTEEMDETDPAKPETAEPTKPEEPTTPDAEKAGEANEPVIVVVENEDGKEFKVKLVEGASISKSFKDGEYTDKDGKYTVTVKGGRVAGWVENTTETAPGEAVGKPLEDRVSELEQQVDDLYNIVLTLTEKMQGSETKIEETVAEFKKIKAQPSATPVHFGKEVTDTPMSRIEKLKSLKLNK